jgi:uncharacterized protein (TIGR02611 family)
MRVPGGTAAKRIVLEIVGWVLVVAGIAALVLPGPGLLMLFGGLAILSQQYEWAERRLIPVERMALRAAAEGVETWPRIAMSTAGGLAIVACGILWIVDPDVPGWWPLPSSWWLPGEWATGCSLVVSGVVALALLFYSYRRFRVRGEAPEPRLRSEQDR